MSPLLKILGCLQVCIHLKLDRFMEIHSLTMQCSWTVFYGPQEVMNSINIQLEITTGNTFDPSIKVIKPNLTLSHSPTHPDTYHIVVSYLLSWESIGTCHSGFCVSSKWKYDILSDELEEVGLECQFSPAKIWSWWHMEYNQEVDSTLVWLSDRESLGIFFLLTDSWVEKVARRLLGGFRTNFAGMRLEGRVEGWLFFLKMIHIVGLWFSWFEEVPLQVGKSS